MSHIMQTVARAECRVDERHILTLLVGFSIGFCLAYTYLLVSNRDFVLRGKINQPGLNIRHDQNTTEGPHLGEDRSVADELYKTVRVLCLVMTHPKNHRKKADHVMATWGKRCNIILFMTTEGDNILPAVKLPVREGRNNLWAKTKEAFRYVYENHRRDADWFLKTDDDTYVIVENLRYMLAEHNSSDPLYFGCRFKKFAKQGFMSGGAGYVISKEALTRLVNTGLPSPKLCKMENDGDEDVQLGVCLEHLGVKAMDSRDEKGHGRFFPFIPEHHLFPDPDPKFWYWKYIYYATDEGLDCCSDLAITFHYLSPKEMYVMDYLVYHLRPYGVKSGGHDVVPKNKIH